MAVSWPPMFFRWREAKRGEIGMFPVQPSVAASWFADGELYRLEAIEERSGKQHRRYFATIRESWGTINELDAGRFPTPEHLRAYALVKTGWYEEKAIPLPTRVEAMKVAAWTRNFDSFAVILVSPVDPEDPEGPTAVKVHTAKSQSIRNMKNEDFKKSSEQVLHFIDDLLGVARGTVRNQRGSA